MIGRAVMIGHGAHALDMLNDLRLPGIRSVEHHHDYIRRQGDSLVYIGVNDPTLRAKIAGELGIDDTIWVHRSVISGPRVELGAGTHLNYGVSLTRTTIGAHCTIGPGVTICGDVTIGDRVLIGAGAIICDRVRIGDDCVIGAGTVMVPTHTCPAGTKWVGAPARNIG